MVLADQPSAYWPLNDAPNSFMVHEIANHTPTRNVWVAFGGLGAPGIPAGGTSWHYNGPMDWNFTQAGYWEADHCDAIDLVDPFTVEAWFKSDIGFHLREQVLVQKMAAYGPANWNHPFAGGGYGLSTRYYHGGFQSHVAKSGVYDGHTLYTNAKPGPGGWTHVMVTLASGALTVYVNGIADASMPVPAGYPATSGSPLRIGGASVPLYWCINGPESYCGNPPFHGSMAHLAFYKRALGPADAVRHNDAGRAQAVPVNIGTWGRIKTRYR
jgi:hypothetical protein